VRAAYERAGGEPVPTVAYSIGLGHEGPVAGGGLSSSMERAQSLDEGMVLGVKAFVTGPDGGYLGEDMVLVTGARPEPLTLLGYGPLADRP
jgi:hypothetical protein